jgi:hypothetical protein
MGGAVPIGQSTPPGSSGSTGPKPIGYDTARPEQQAQQAAADKTAADAFVRLHGQDYSGWVADQQSATARQERAQLQALIQRDPNVKAAYDKLVRLELAATRAQAVTIDAQQEVLLAEKAGVLTLDVAVAALADLPALAVAGAAGTVAAGATFTASQLLTDYSLRQKSVSQVGGEAFVAGVQTGALIDVPGASAAIDALRAAVEISKDAEEFNATRTK